MTPARERYLQYLRSYRKRSEVVVSERKRANERAAAKRAEKRDILIKAKDAPCTDCGVRYPHYVMDLDHVRGHKLFNLSQTKLFRIKDMGEEIDKCDVVCANCHRIRTHRRAEMRREHG